MILAAAVVLAATAIAIAALVQPRPSRHLDARAQDLSTYAENLERLVAAYSDQLTQMADRKVDEMALLLRGARADRDRLLTALLAFTNPQAAVTVGRIDQATARATEPLTMRTFMDETRETETQDGEGNPIIPVGMG